MAFDKPQSRNEAILQNMLGANNELEPPKSRVEALLQELSGQMPEANPSEGTTTGTLERLKIGDDIYTVEGGGSGTSDYDALNNKPKIASVTLSGDKSLADLGIASATTVSGILDGTDIDSFGDVETALAGKQGTLTAGDYISLNNGNIAVNRNIVRDNYAYNIKFSGDNDLTVTKSQGGTVISTTQYTYEYGSGGGVTYTIDDAFTLETLYHGGQYFKYTALRDSTTHSAGYTWEVDARDTSTDVTEYFSSEDLSGYKLVIKSEMDTALSGKQDTLTFDDAPTDNSNNPVKSNGIYDALALKQNATDNSLETEAKTIVGAINEHEGDIDTLKSGLTTLDNEVNGDATVYPYADVITIEDAVPANVADCSVKIEPVQDLHGYDKPWVGGAGKNKFNLSISTQTVSDVTITVNDDGTFYTSGTASADIGIILGESDAVTGTSYKLNGCPAGGSENTYKLVACDAGTGMWYSDKGDGADNIDGNRVKKVKLVIASGTNVSGLCFKPMVYLNSETDATFAPYSNECPITGHTNASVDVHHPDFYTTANTVGMNQQTTVEILSDNSFRVYNTTAKTYISSKQLVSRYNLLVGKTYTMEADADIVSGNARLSIRNEANSIVAGSDGISESGHLVCTFTLTSEMNYISFFATYDSAVIGDVTYKNIKFYEGEPKTYTIALGDTIYGGSVDFNTGLMTVTHQYVTKNTSTMNNLEQYPGWTGSGIKQIVGSGIDDVVSTCVNVSDVIRANTLNINDILFFEKNDIGLTQTELIALAIDVAFVVELATPTTIQLTPQQIQLLKGTNTLTASTGQISVTVNGVSGAIGSLQTQANTTDEALAELAEKLPTAPTTDGAYVLTVTVADGTPTYSWESAS